MNIILILTWFSTGNGHHIHHDVDEILGYHDTPAGPWEESPSTIPRQAANGGWISAYNRSKGQCHRDNTNGSYSNIMIDERGNIWMRSSDYYQYGIPVNPGSVVNPCRCKRTSSMEVVQDEGVMKDLFLIVLTPEINIMTRQNWAYFTRSYFVNYSIFHPL